MKYSLLKHVKEKYPARSTECYKFEKTGPEGLEHRCFPLKFAKFLKTPILKNNRMYLCVNLYLQCMKKKQLTRHN